MADYPFKPTRRGMLGVLATGAALAAVPAMAAITAPSTISLGATRWSQALSYNDAAWVAFGKADTAWFNEDRRCKALLPEKPKSIRGLAYHGLDDLSLERIRELREAQIFYPNGTAKAALVERDVKAFSDYRAACAKVMEPAERLKLERDRVYAIALGALGALATTPAANLTEAIDKLQVGLDEGRDDIADAAVHDLRRFAGVAA
jgi:hypothetical protein